MKSEKLYTIRHTLTQSVADALQKVITDGYQLRTIYLLTRGPFTNLENSNLKKPYAKADWKWTSVDAGRIAIYFDNNNRSKGILLTSSIMEEYPNPDTPIKYGFTDIQEPEYFEKNDPGEYLETRAYEQLEAQSDHIIRMAVASGKIAAITIYSIVHRGKVKAIVDSWDTEDDEIPEYNIDFDIDGFLTFECPDENLKIVWFGQKLYIGHSGETPEFEIDYYGIYYVIKQEIKPDP